MNKCKNCKNFKDMSHINKSGHGKCKYITKSDIIRFFIIKGLKNHTENDIKNDVLYCNMYDKIVSIIDDVSRGYLEYTDITNGSEFLKQLKRQ